MIQFQLNDKAVEADVPGETPLLWVLREEFGLTGSKFGCGGGYCGCCAVHLNGAAIRSCVTPISAAQGQKITTIEGLQEGDDLHPVQKAWIAQDVAQCGYCQAGQIMSAAALLKTNANPSDEEIDRGMEGNLCRCGSYHRIRLAVRTAAGGKV